MPSAASRPPSRPVDVVTTGPADVVLVAAGGAAGAVLRQGLGALLPDDPVSVGVVVANLLGALLLGVLAGSLPGRRTGLFLGTGVLGAFTTFSAMTVQAVGLGPVDGTVLVLLQVAAGVALARLGLTLGRGLALGGGLGR